MLPNIKKPESNIEKIYILFFWLIVTDIFIYFYSNSETFHSIWNLFFDWCTAGVP